MKYISYSMLIIGLLGCAVFLVALNAVELGVCPETRTLPSGFRYCVTSANYADYLWPLWDFSRALLLVGIMTFIRPTLSLRFVILTGIFALATMIGVLLAPSVSSDFLVPVEKKIVGTLLSGLYLLIAVIMFLWLLFRTSKS